MRLVKSRIFLTAATRWRFFLPPGMAGMSQMQDAGMDARGRATQEQLPSNLRRRPWMADMPKMQEHVSAERF
jgi:hypothetical protein